MDIIGGKLVLVVVSKGVGLISSGIGDLSWSLFLGRKTFRMLKLFLPSEVLMSSGSVLMGSPLITFNGSKPFRCYDVVGYVIVIEIFGDGRVVFFRVRLYFEITGGVLCS
ncbi:hypothetical protein CEXT_582591 [Caerostris extrusa]|uniref:Uncharacterized protein n=1 Tax=Caerostris extrusa TaxID=172846 RepID=A0AAV4YF80_CAEEX|nr:hypothetical protein CEXT_582591 [Caerostris extrusa]